MANHFSHAALPYPIRKARFTVAVPYLDADGDPTDPTTPDTEISKDAAAYADCVEEVTTITGSNGSGIITLGGAEMDAALIMLAAKVTSGPKATLAAIFPRNLPAIVSAATLSAGSASGGTLTTPIAYDITGCFVRTVGGTGGGGTGGVNNQARRIATYNGSTGAFTVAVDFETAVDATTTVDILLPEGVTLGMLRTLDVGSGILPVGPIPAFGIVDNGTAQAATSTTTQIRAAATFADHTCAGMTLLAKGSTQGYWQAVPVDDNVGATDTLSHPAWPVTPSGTITYILIGTAAASINSPIPASLSASERTALANAVETEIIDDTDSEKVLAAIVNKIAAANPDLSGLTLAAIAAAVRDVTNAAPTAGSLGAGIKAVSDRVPGAGTLATTSDIPAAAAIAAAVRDISNAAPAGGSLGAALNAVPTAAQVRDAILLLSLGVKFQNKTVLDGIKLATAGVGGVSVKQDATTALVKTPDGSDTLATLTFDAVSGEVDSVVLA